MLRRVPSHSQSVFLTFDDGPDPVGTPAVLDVLRSRKARATFFVVAEKAKAHPEILRRIVEEGHAVGNHSLDHTYRNFFRGLSSLRAWILAGERELKLEGVSSVGFRPPAGVMTPKLRRVLSELSLPVVMWNERFYDAVIPWGPRQAKRSAANLAGGSIVLLHDRQRLARVEGFCKTLGAYLDELRGRGLEFEPLTLEICKSGGLL